MRDDAPLDGTHRAVVLLLIVIAYAPPLDEAAANPGEGAPAYGPESPIPRGP